jgi:hypothetical protein
MVRGFLLKPADRLHKAFGSDDECQVSSLAHAVADSKRCRLGDSPSSHSPLARPISVVAHRDRSLVGNTCCVLDCHSETGAHALALRAIASLWCGGISKQQSGLGRAGNLDGSGEHEGRWQNQWVGKASSKLHHVSMEEVQGKFANTLRLKCVFIVNVKPSLRQ